MRTKVREVGGRFEMRSYSDGRLIGAATVREATESELQSSSVGAPALFVEVFDVDGLRVGQSLSQILDKRQAAKDALAFHLIFHSRR